MCTVLLPPGDNPIAVNKYIMSYVLHSHPFISSSPPCMMCVCVRARARACCTLQAFNNLTTVMSCVNLAVEQFVTLSVLGSYIYIPFFINNRSSVFQLKMLCT